MASPSAAAAAEPAGALVPGNRTGRTAGASIRLRAAVLGALLVAGGVVAVRLDLPSGEQLRTLLDGGGAEVWVLLVVALAVALLAPVPRSVLSALAGAVLGFGPGLAVALSGGLLGAAAAFGLSRTLGRPAAERLAGPRLRRADRLVAGRGFLWVLGGRLVPVAPFVVVSYGAGLAGVRFGHFLAATAVGLVPSTVLQVGAGASTGVLVSWLGGAG